MKAFYDEQVALLAARNADDLVDKHYADDAEMVVLSGEEPIVVKGSDALKNLFSSYLEYVYRGFISTEKFASTDDSLMFEATIDTVNGPVRIYDAMVLKDGKIVKHYSGVK
ncbi:nuclear transport factor 2 family protein [Dyadobacter aurulentus]|uniref:nuclear transport factor 2 family protein n=1 Tax=Dyadobacter sp. UC 10 TaxID=2605428 RepID=UPI0011F3B3BC|nr:nuclear transport factor 2 family protein [Dyadobacter sp. UC 10]KAA0993062.1 nuclear transport factor 2 family protein [Dyadobacter sp. UC 10]